MVSSSIQYNLTGLCPELFIQLCSFLDVLDRDGYNALSELYFRDVNMQVPEVRRALHRIMFYGTPKNPSKKPEDEFEVALLGMAPRMQYYACRDGGYPLTEMFRQDFELACERNLAKLVGRTVEAMRARQIKVRDVYTYTNLSTAIDTQDDELAAALLCKADYDEERHHPVRMCMPKHEAGALFIGKAFMAPYIEDRVANMSALEYYFDSFTPGIRTPMLEALLKICDRDAERVASMVNKSMGSHASERFKGVKLCEAVMEVWNDFPDKLYRTVCQYKTCWTILFQLDDKGLMHGKEHPIHLVRHNCDMIECLRRTWKCSLTNSTPNEVMLRFNRWNTQLKSC